MTSIFLIQRRPERRGKQHHGKGNDCPDVAAYDYCIIVSDCGRLRHHCLSLFRLQIIQGEELQTRAVNQQTQDTSLSAKRGTIYDCNMKVLATSADVWKVVLDPNYIRKELVQDQARKTSRTKLPKGLPGSWILRRLMYVRSWRSRTYYAVVKTKVETDLKDQILELKEELSLGNAIQLEPDYKRYYPYGAFASSVLGFTNSENQGVTGVEASYNDYLSGTPGKLVTAKNARGVDMPFQYEQLVEAQDGYSLVLTIDEVVQHFLEKSVEERRKAARPETVPAAL